MKRPRAQGGLTLLELVAAIALFALVATAVVNLQMTALRNQNQAMGGFLADSNALMAGDTLRGLTGAVSFVESPSTASASTSGLLVWQNILPLTPTSTAGTPLVASLPVAGAYFCADPSNSLFLYTTNAYPMPAGVLIPANCGKAESGISPTLLAGSLDGRVSIFPLFNRPLGLNNILQIQYLVRVSSTPSHPMVDNFQQMQIAVVGSM